MKDMHTPPGFYDIEFWDCSIYSIHYTYKYPSNPFIDKKNFASLAASRVWGNFKLIQFFYTPCSFEFNILMSDKRQYKIKEVNE
jgi:hypothetical protein